MTPTLSPFELFAFIWPRILVMDVARYVIATALISAIVAAVMASAWAVRRIQSRRAGRTDYRREILTSLRTAVVFSLVGSLIFVGQNIGVMPAALPWSWGTGLLTLAAMLLAHDTYFYWTHRALHHRRLFRRVHLTHHQSITPTPFTAYAFSVPEALVQAVFVPLWLMFVPMPLPALAAFMMVMILRNAWGHAGVEMHPRGMADHPVFGLLTTTLHHDLHHAGEFNCNFGLYFTWWDRIMGTEHPEYRRRFRDITERSPAPHAGKALGEPSAQ